MIQSAECWLDIPQEKKTLLNQANVYYSQEYEQIERSRGNIPVYIYNDNYILIVSIRKKYLFKYASIPSECFAFENSDDDELQIFLDDSMTLLKRKYKLQWVGPTENQALFSMKPQGSISIPFGSHIIDLTLDTDQLWSNLHSKHRNVIRKGQKDGLEIKVGNSPELMDIYIQLDKETWARSNIKSNTKELVERMLNFARNNTVIYLVYKDGIPQGGAVFFWNACRSYYLFGASIDKPYTGSMNLLHWQAILDMKQRGVREYSFVGCRINEDVDSKSHTIQRFKERFGGPVRQGYMFKYIFNNNMYQLYCNLKYIKNNKGKKYPLDIIDQEVLKYRKNL